MQGCVGFFGFKLVMVSKKGIESRLEGRGGLDGRPGVCSIASKSLFCHALEVPVSVENHRFCRP